MKIQLQYQSKNTTNTNKINSNTNMTDWNTAEG